MKTLAKYVLMLAVVAFALVLLMIVRPATKECPPRPGGIIELFAPGLSPACLATAK